MSQTDKGNEAIVLRKLAAVAPHSESRVNEQRQRKSKQTRRKTIGRGIVGLLDSEQFWLWSSVLIFAHVVNAILDHAFGWLVSR